MSTRMSTESKAIQYERRVVDREHTATMTQARRVKEFVRGAK